MSVTQPFASTARFATATGATFVTQDRHPRFAGVGDLAPQRGCCVSKAVSLFGLLSRGRPGRATRSAPPTSAIFEREIEAEFRSD